MPRAFAKVNVAIWQDPDFRRLPPAAQHLYLLLWTAPELSFCGVHDWRPGRLSHLSEGFAEDHTRRVGDCLAARHFLVIDTDTEEVLIRSWVRFDEVLKQPRLAVSYVNAYNSTYSAPLRSVMVHEARKVREQWPELACWRDQRVISVLDQEGISAKDLPTPQDPFGPEFGGDFGDGFGLGLAQSQGKVWGSVSVPPTTATTTTTNRQQPGVTKSSGKTTARRRASSLSESFKPNDTNKRLAEERGLDLAVVVAQFVDHHKAKGSTFVDWHSALNTWIRREKFAPIPAVRRLPSVQDLEMPPDGLSPEEYADWERESRARRQAR